MLLVLLCLGGVAVDLTIVHGAHRGAHRIVSAAADDAAAMIDTDLLQESGGGGGGSGSTRCSPEGSHWPSSTQWSSPGPWSGVRS